MDEIFIRVSSCAACTLAWDFISSRGVFTLMIGYKSSDKSAIQVIVSSSSAFTTLVDTMFDPHGSLPRKLTETPENIP